MPPRRVMYGFLVAAFMCPRAFAGAWGAGSFDNDDALDWISELEQAASPSVLFLAFTGVSSESDYVEAPRCSAALAAAEVVAAAQGRPSKALPNEVRRWLKRVRPTIGAELVRNARGAVSFCRDSQNSELRQLWAESEDFQAWLAGTASLLSRLN